MTTHLALRTVALMLVTVLAHSALPGIATAQGRPDFSDEVSGAMAPMAWIIGDWEGEATIRMGNGEPETVAMVETAEYLLDGQVLTFKGVGRVDGEIVHHAFATISFDALEDAFTMRSFTAEGMHSDPEVVIDEDGALTWTLVAPMGTMRYVIRQDDGGRWVETGAFSRDGETFNDFFKMVLTRVR